MPTQPELPNSISGTVIWILAWILAAFLARIGWELAGMLIARV